MSTAKIAISLDKKTLLRLDRLVKTRIFPSRSKIIQDAGGEKFKKIDRSHLKRDCLKFGPDFEKALAEIAPATFDLDYPFLRTTLYPKT